MFVRIKDKSFSKICLPQSIFHYEIEHEPDKTSFLKKIFHFYLFLITFL